MIPQSLIDAMIDWRHLIHANPETAFEEVATAKLVASILRENGLEVAESIGKTGVVGTLRRGQGPSLGLRADMDALPLSEKNEFAHCSRTPGKMHGCGHDGHTTMLLGAAVALAQDKNWQGTLHFIFQPAEEFGGGARKMIEDGLFERFPCDKVFAMHNWPSAPLGQFLINHGPMMASSDNFEISIQGKGAHAAMPETGVDVLVCASQILLALQTITSRRLSPRETAVVSATQMHGGGDAYNVLPDNAFIRGTVRCFSKATQSRIQQLMVELAEGIARANGASATVTYDAAYAATVNAAAEADLAIAAARAVSGEAMVITNADPAMGSEDFSFFLERVPGAYIWMGTNEGQPVAPLHNPRYDFNDKALGIGASYWVELVRHITKA